MSPTSDVDDRTHDSPGRQFSRASVRPLDASSRSSSQLTENETSRTLLHDECRAFRPYTRRHAQLPFTRQSRTLVRHQAMHCLDACLSPLGV